MEILQLRYFCLAAEEENFSAVANKFGVPPSNISQSIKRLERELCTSLFSRSANRIKLNDAGRTFYENIKEALKLIDSAKTSALSGSDEIKISIRTNRRIVMQAIERFRIEHPNINIIAKHNPLDKNDDFDLIVSAEDMSCDGYESLPILDECLLLAVKRSGPLDSNLPISAEVLKNESFITMNAGTSMHGLTLRLGERLGFRPKIVLQSDDPFYIRRCAELGLGSVVVPSVSWRGQFSDDIVFRELPEMRRMTYVSRKKSLRPSKSAEHFISLLTEECNRESKQ